MEETDRSKLPPDALSVVFAGLSAVEVLMGAGLVCHSWFDAAAMAPHLWRSLAMELLQHNNNAALKNRHVLRKMAKAGGSRCSRRTGRFVDDELLEYIARRPVLFSRSPSLKSLTLVECSITNGVPMAAVGSCPCLELLYVSDGALLAKCTWRDQDTDDHPLL